MFADTLENNPENGKMGPRKDAPEQAGKGLCACFYVGTSLTLSKGRVEETEVLFSHLCEHLFSRRAL